MSGAALTDFWIGGANDGSEIAHVVLVPVVHELRSVAILRASAQKVYQGLLLFGDPYDMRLEQYAFRRGERFTPRYDTNARPCKAISATR